MVGREDGRRRPDDWADLCGGHLVSLSVNLALFEIVRQTRMIDLRLEYGDSGNKERETQRSKTNQAARPVHMIPLRPSLSSPRLPDYNHLEHDWLC